MGSRLGWILAVVFGGFLAIVIVKVVFYPAPTPPTRATTGPGMLSLQRPEKPITLVLPAEPSAEGDAGDDYYRAIRLYKQNQAALEELFSHELELVKKTYRLSAADLDVLKPIAEAVSAGAARKKMTYYFRLTPRNIKIPYYADEAGQFQDVFRAVRFLAVHYVNAGPEKYPRAEKCLLDVFTMAHHLMQERARLEIVRAGIGLQKDACDLLSQLYSKWGKTHRSRQVQDYRRGLRLMSGTYASLQKLIWKLERRQGGAGHARPGDIFNIVANHADRAVRVEAALALGVVKLTCTSRGDRRMARKLIAEKLESEDPIERAAAKCAQALDQKGLEQLAAG